MLARQRQHPLDHHVVQRDRLDEQLGVVRVHGQAVHPAVEHLVEQHVEVRREVVARLGEARG